jgi:hypothetical protein
VSHCCCTHVAARQVPLRHGLLPELALLEIVASGVLHHHLRRAGIRLLHHHLRLAVVRLLLHDHDPWLERVVVVVVVVPGRIDLASAHLMRDETSNVAVR